MRLLGGFWGAKAQTRLKLDNDLRLYELLLAQIQHNIASIATLTSHLRKYNPTASNDN
jgi:hypothetical protein